MLSAGGFLLLARGILLGGHSLMFLAAGVRKRNTLTQIDVCAKVNVSIDINVKGADIRSALLKQTKGGRLYAGTEA